MTYLTGWRCVDVVDFVDFLFFGADFTDCTVGFLVVVAIGIQAPEFLLRTILRRLRGNQFWRRWNLLTLISRQRVKVAGFD